MTMSATQNLIIPLPKDSEMVKGPHRDPNPASGRTIRMNQCGMAMNRRQGAHVIYRMICTSNVWQLFGRAFALSLRTEPSKPQEIVSPRIGKKKSKPI